MGAIKDNFYTSEESNLFYVGRAFAHPARVKMITELLVEMPNRNIDLARILHLSSPTIKDHVEKLKDAELVNVNYFMHYYEISLNEKGRYWSELFLNSLKRNRAILE